MGMALSKAPGRGSEGTPPTEHGGGGGDPSGGSPNYPDRLRRARMGLAVALAPVIMLFVSFSAAFVARRLFSSDSATPSQFQKWISTPVPWNLLLLNTLVLLVSSVTIEMARRHLTKQVALAPVKTIPGVSLGHEKHSVAGLHHRPRYPVFTGTVARVESNGVARSGAVFNGEQFVFLLAHWNARRTSCWRYSCSLICSVRCFEAFRSGAAAHYHRRRCLVLALHGRVVDLHSHFDRDRPLVREDFL